jgi:small conductance mechanosensitive channel
MDFQKALELITGKLSGWISELIKLLPNILLATLVLVLGFALARGIKKYFLKLIQKISDKHLINKLFASIVHIFFVGIVLFTVLSILQLDKAVTTILAGAGILGLGLAFAFQDIAANFMSGIFLTFRKPMNVGDMVKLHGYTGTVKEINLRDTVLVSFQGQTIIIPNKDVFSNPIENYTASGKRRFDLQVGVSYGEDLEKVRTVTMEAVRNLEGLSKDDETSMFYREFGDSSINYTIRLWISSTDQSAYQGIGDKAIVQIKKAYDMHNISIPFPIRTLDFGIKGGVSLSEIKEHRE